MAGSAAAGAAAGVLCSTHEVPSAYDGGTALLSILLPAGQAGQQVGRGWRQGEGRAVWLQQPAADRSHATCLLRWRNALQLWCKESLCINGGCLDLRSRPAPGDGSGAWQGVLSMQVATVPASGTDGSAAAATASAEGAGSVGRSHSPLQRASSSPFPCPCAECRGDAGGAAAAAARRGRRLLT